MTNILIVQSNPVTGMEEEYNDWYSNQHLKDVLALPGITAAQRFRISDTQYSSATPEPTHRYIAIYEFEGEARAAFDALQAASQAGMYVSPALDSTRLAHLWEPITERLVEAVE